MAEFKDHSLLNALTKANNAYKHDRYYMPFEVKKRWDWRDFIKHVYKGKGKGVTLKEIGLLDDVIAYAEKIAIFRKGGFRDQIRNKAQQVQNGVFSQTFERGYNFDSVYFCLGGGVLKGKFNDSAALKGNKIHISGSYTIHYSDKFTDPAHLREKLGRQGQWTDLGMTRYKITGQWQENFSDIIDAR